jgi:hypothetical protein
MAELTISLPVGPTSAGQTPVGQASSGQDLAPADPTTAGSAASGATAAGDLVCHCGHVLTGHDPVGARYCRATLSGALTRGCICRPGTPTDAAAG